MTQTEIKLQLEERRKVLENRLECIYTRQIINGWNCFSRPDGSLFVVDSILSFGAIVIGYADSHEDVMLNRFEDGDRFSLYEIDEETMFQSILKEITQQ